VNFYDSLRHAIGDSLVGWFNTLLSAGVAAVMVPINGLLSLVPRISVPTVSGVTASIDWVWPFVLWFNAILPLPLVAAIIGAWLIIWQFDILASILLWVWAKIPVLGH